MANFQWGVRKKKNSVSKRKKERSVSEAGTRTAERKEVGEPYLFETNRTIPDWGAIPIRVWVCETQTAMRPDPRRPRAAA